MVLYFVLFSSHNSSSRFLPQFFTSPLCKYLHTICICYFSLVSHFLTELCSEKSKHVCTTCILLHSNFWVWYKMQPNKVVFPFPIDVRQNMCELWPAAKQPFRCFDLSPSHGIIFVAFQDYFCGTVGLFL